MKPIYMHTVCTLYWLTCVQYIVYRAKKKKNYINLYLMQPRQARTPLLFLQYTMCV